MTTTHYLPTPEEVRKAIEPCLEEGMTLHHLPNPDAHWSYVWEIRNGRFSYGFSTTQSLLDEFGIVKI